MIKKEKKFKRSLLKFIKLQVSNIFSGKLSGYGFL